MQMLGPTNNLKVLIKEANDLLIKKEDIVIKLKGTIEQYEAQIFKEKPCNPLLFILNLVRFTSNFDYRILCIYR